MGTYGIPQIEEPGVSPLAEKVLGLLEEAGMDTATNDKIVRVLEAIDVSEHACRALLDVCKERQHQRDLAHGGDTQEFDKTNTRNDWIAYLNAYSGRAAQKVFRNEREGQIFRDNMVKVAALALAAIEAHDAGFC